MPTAPATPQNDNPWADYGLNPDGTPIEDAAGSGQGGDGALDGDKGKGDNPPDPRDAKIAALETQLKEANEKLKGLDSYNEKFKVVDKLVKALAGDDDPNAKAYKRVWNDLKEIAPAGVRKALEILEQDPEALERLTGSISSLHIGRLADLNAQAHSRVVEMAKKAFPVKGMTPAEVNELVFPFERTMTDIINSNRTLRDRFVAGDMSVVEELFTRLAKPHISARLRDKQRRAEGVTAPKAPPKGAGGPGAGEDKDNKKPDLRTPKGRAAFHKQALARFFQKYESRSDDE